MISYHYKKIVRFNASYSWKVFHQRWQTTREGEIMTTLHSTSRNTKTIEIESTSREDTPFRLVLTLKKLGVITMLDYFLSEEEATQISAILNIKTVTQP